MREILFRTICIPNTGDGEGGFFCYGGTNEQGEESTCDNGRGIGSVYYMEESQWDKRSDYTGLFDTCELII